jgi:hypothetical protein
MKIFLFSFFLSSLCFAYNTKYFDVQSNSLKSINVENEASTTSLRVWIESPSSFSIPEADVLKEDSDFECRITRKILLFAGYNAETKIHRQQFEIKVEWSPGADMSGCLIEVKHPSLTNAKAYLFMNY